MRKILCIILILLFPISIYAKTPNQEETKKVITNIENVQVDDNTKILDISLSKDYIILNMEENQKYQQKKLKYKWSDTGIEFYGGTIEINQQTGNSIKNNEIAFYLYSILESLSNIPYNEDNYYNNQNITKIIETDKNLNQEIRKTYKEPTNTFGLTLTKDKQQSFQISYHYYYNGDYPIFIEESQENITNPSTGNYPIIITIMVVLTSGTALYTYLEPKKGEYI